MPEIILLDSIKKPDGILLEKAILKRRSKRAKYKKSITKEALSRLLFAAYGKTDKERIGVGWYRRAVPSAGATYPLEFFVLIKSAKGIPEGIHYYNQRRHALELLKDGDYSDIFANACGKYQFVADAPATIIIAAEFSRTTLRYKDRGTMYVHMEAGSAYQNISLEAVNLGLGTVVVGEFDEEKVKGILETDFRPLCVLPVG